MKPFTKFTSRLVPLPIDNIDTDQIIPARFLKVTAKEGLADGLFCDWRYDAQGRPKPGFILNQPRGKAGQILLAGDNFGCGSSREHAPWALTQFGFRAVISTSFADIFRQNALKNSLLPIIVPREVHAELFALDPEAEVTVDLAERKLLLPGGRAVEFPIDPFAQCCLLDGVDELGYILQREAAISAYEASHPARINTLAG
ncbi:MAG: 3-isopropylmalate dehydratase small subunit [Acidobacteria bacterium]|nr:3-isopropylmalate dehydratase small subunit [Acidobacteriota bacterium]